MLTIANDASINEWLQRFVVRWQPAPVVRAAQAGSHDVDTLLAIVATTAPHGPTGVATMLATLQAVLRHGGGDPAQRLAALARGTWWRRAHAVVAFEGPCDVHSQSACCTPVSTRCETRCSVASTVADDEGVPCGGGGVTPASPSSLCGTRCDSCEEPASSPTVDRAGRLLLLPVPVSTAPRAPDPSCHRRRLLSSGFMLVAAASLCPLLWVLWMPPRRLSSGGLARWQRLKRAWVVRRGTAAAVESAHPPQEDVLVV